LAVKLSIVPQDHTDGVWPHVEGHLLKSYRRCDQNIPLSLRYDLRNGIRQLWLLTRGDVTIVAAGVTSMHALRSGLALKIEHFGGSFMGNGRSLLREVEEYAKSQGCNKVMFDGRVGLKRLCPDYEVSALVMEKRLDDDG
jgi:hypothetical protein